MFVYMLQWSFQIKHNSYQSECPPLNVVRISTSLAVLLFERKIMYVHTSSVKVFSMFELVTVSRNFKITRFWCYFSGYIYMKIFCRFDVFWSSWLSHGGTQEKRNSYSCQGFGENINEDHINASWFWCWLVSVQSHLYRNSLYGSRCMWNRLTMGSIAWLENHSRTYIILPETCEYLLKVILLLSLIVNTINFIDAERPKLIDA